jgi:hypothetical protein
MKKIFKNRLLGAAVMLQLLDLAGAFVILLPFLISMRNILESSAVARELWPVISPAALADILINHSQMLATAVTAGITVYIIYAFLRAYFSAGIYKVLLATEENIAGREAGALPGFLSMAARSWPGFLKIALFAIVVYTIAAFIGLIIGRVFGVLGFFWRIAFLLFTMLIGSTYIQILKIKVVTDNDNSFVKAVKGTRQAIGGAAFRIIAGNLSVGVAGSVIGYFLWRLIIMVRGNEWSPMAAGLTVALEQIIILIFCLMQAIRINFNYSILRKGTPDAVGRTELGGI